MKMIEIDRMARLGEALQGVGDTFDCQNLCEQGGSLEALMPAEVVATIGARPAACDVRDDRIAIITQDDDGTLRVACILGEGLEATYPDLEIGRLDERLMQGVRVGSFMVLRGESGRLYYLHDGAEGGYSWLGNLPDAPQWQAEAASEVTLTGEVPAVSFKSVVADPRVGIGSDNEKRVSRALMDAFNTRVEELHVSGYRCMPVMVRVAWRLKDGGLLCVSPAVRVSGSQQLPARERIMLGFETTEKGCTGTRAGAFSINAWRLKVTLLAPLSPQWSEVIEGAEVWVSREPDILREGAEPGMGFYQGANGSQLTCSLPAVSDAQIEAQLPELAMRAELLMLEGGSRFVGCGDSPLSEEMTGVSAPGAGESALDESADCIMAYADTLYTARGNALTTSRRGNPLVSVSTTADVGGRVLAIWPQLRGGGAYTRQYIYLSTPHGLAALMHDKEGIHTNCRMVAPLRVADAFPTLSGLYVAGTGGEVLLVTDAVCRRIYRDIEGVSRVGYSESRGLLMLMNDTCSLLLGEDSDFRATRRNFTMTMLSGCFHRRLGWYEMRRGEVQIYDADREREGVPSGLVWRGRLPPPPGGKHRPRVLYVAVTGGVVMAQIRVRAGRGRVLTDLVRAQVTGSVEAGVRVPVTLPRGVTDWELTVSGSYDRLDGVSWE